MKEYELIALTLVGFLESCKEEQLKMMSNIKYQNINVSQNFGLDEAKILRKAIKLYRTHNSNPTISTMITSYLNSK